MVVGTGLAVVVVVGVNLGRASVEFSMVGGSECEGWNKRGDYGKGKVGTKRVRDLF